MENSGERGPRKGEEREGGREEGRRGGEWLAVITSIPGRMQRGREGENLVINKPSLLQSVPGEMKKWHLPLITYSSHSLSKKAPMEAIT